MSYQEKFADKDYCLSELHEARRIFTEKSFTAEVGDRLIKGLALMLFYCPEELATTVEATIYECERRSFYAIGVSVKQEVNETASLRAQRDELLEALKLMFSLHEQACIDVEGCPYECHNDNCEDCLPSRAEKSARAALGVEIKPKEEEVC